jgi:hypothetical protein
LVRVIAKDGPVAIRNVVETGVVSSQADRISRCSLTAFSAITGYRMRLATPDMANRSEDDLSRRLQMELRASITRLGSALAVATYLRGQGETALDRLRQEIARAEDIQRVMAPLGHQFPPLYDRLRETAEQLGRAQHSAGSSPERARALLESIVQEAKAPGLTPDTLGLVQEDVVRWGMDAYEAA